MIKVEKKADALKVEGIVKKAPSKLAKRKADIAFEMAEEIAEAAKQSIINQTAGFAPVSASTARKKTDPRVLIETGEYVASIRGIRYGEGAAVQGDAIGMLHENGTSKMPARPHIGPAIAKAKVPSRIDKILMTIFEDE